ncbi:hypothetical protein, partial [Rossellomorea vietnamensis]|uniref:hypothetical protein n=1 Tax=Rossellomorea vietnamensis TaxID=218284 RepID=UPI001CA3C6B3
QGSPKQDKNTPETILLQNEEISQEVFIKVYRNILSFDNRFYVVCLGYHLVVIMNILSARNLLHQQKRKRL